MTKLAIEKVGLSKITWTLLFVIVFSFLGTIYFAISNINSMSIKDILALESRLNQLRFEMKQELLTEMVEINTRSEDNKKAISNIEERLQILESKTEQIKE